MQTTRPPPLQRLQLLPLRPRLLRPRLRLRLRLLHLRPRQPRQRLRQQRQQRRPRKRSRRLHPRFPEYRLLRYNYRPLRKSSKRLPAQPMAGR